MSAHVQLHQASVLTGRQMVMAATIGMHALAIMALLAVRTIIPDVPGSRSTYIDPVPQKESEPIVDNRPIPIDKPLFERVPLRADIPLVRPEYQVEEPFNPPAEPTSGKEGVSGGSEQGSTSGRGAEIVSTALQFRAVRPADDYYPSDARTLGEEGIAIVKVCVAPTGRIDGRPTIDRSSGSPRLDRAAVAWAREALRFTPATENGVAVAACKGFRVNFTLH